MLKGKEWLEKVLVKNRGNFRTFRTKRLSRTPLFAPGLYHPPFGVHRCMSEFYAPLPTQYKARAKTVFEIVTHGSVSELKEVLSMDGGAANIRNEDLQTPLMVAAGNGNCEMISALIEHGAKVNLQDSLGDTALMLAAREKCKDAVKLLLNVGAQPDIMNYEKMTAADVTLDDDIDTNIRKTQEPDSEPSFK